MRQKEFFEDESHEETPYVPGLRYIPQYITAEQHRSLIMAIDKREWTSELQRRVQHYGYRYDYRRNAKSLQPAPEFPQWAKNLAQKIQRDDLMRWLPDQLIINEYLPGQGISPHVDREDLFGEKIISLSLGSSCVMDLIHLETREKVQILLEPQSILVLSGEARHKWQHGIPGRKVDHYKGEVISRSRRISLTFRSAI